MSEADNKSKPGIPGTRNMIPAVVIGVAGGYVANAVGVPLGWMVGAMMTCGLASSVLGLDMALPRRLRLIVLSIVGIYLGASFSKEVLGWLKISALSLVVMCAMVVAQTVIATYAMAKFLRCNAVTALTSCSPGGFSTMLLLAEENGGDSKVVSVVQLVRLIMVIFSMSLLARLTTLDMSIVSKELVPQDLWWACAIALLGLVLGMMARLPALCMFVPMAVGAVTQMSSLSYMVLPREPLIIALVVLGIFVGCQWRTFRGRDVMRPILAGVGLGVFLLATSVAVAYGTSMLLDVDLLPLILALAPGGVAEISLISVALDLNPSFVILHHLVRVAFIILCLLVLFWTFGWQATRKTRV